MRIKDYLSRHAIIIPAEHGSWSLMLTPLIIGAGVGLLDPAWGAGWSVALTAMLVLAFFLIRQPVSLWLRVRRGKGRRQDGAVALFWIGLLGGIAGLCAIGLWALGRGALFWLAIPAAGVLIGTPAASVLIGPRRLAVEVIGVIGLALAAPAGYVAGAATLGQMAWLSWAVSAAHNAISVLYVRLRIDARHGRATRQQAIWVIAAHALALVAMLGGAVRGWIPPLVVILIGALLIRAIYIGLRQPPIADVRRFGFTEMGLALAFGIGVIVGFWMQV